MLNHVRLFIFILFATAALDAQDSGFFETKIRPVLARDCYACHSASKQFAGLRVDSREALLIGGKRGAAIVPGKPDDSLLIKAIRHSELKMPLGGKLKDSEIAAMEEWIRRGAPWPATASATSQDRYAQLLKQHWAYQPVVKQPLSIDAAIRGQLRKSRLTAAPPADRRTLIRRLSFVLTGLPATADEADQFVTDKSPDAYQKLVDRLLASPRFGEHWARYWLDLVRYGETRGYEWNYEITGAWRYRDYMIRALNSDVPYDQLIREHVAGDLLKSPRINAAEQLNESIIGTAFYRLGEAGHDDLCESTCAFAALHGHFVVADGATHLDECALGQIAVHRVADRAPTHQPVPRGPALPVAVLVLPAFGGRHADDGVLVVVLGLLRLRVAANESDEGDFVRAEFHRSNLLEFSCFAPGLAGHEKQAEALPRARAALLGGPEKRSDSRSEFPGEPTKQKLAVPPGAARPTGRQAQQCPQDRRREQGSGDERSTRPNNVPLVLVMAGSSVRGTGITVRIGDLGEPQARRVRRDGSARDWSGWSNWGGNEVGQVRNASCRF